MNVVQGLSIIQFDAVSIQHANAKLLCHIGWQWCLETWPSVAQEHLVE